MSHQMNLPASPQDPFGGTNPFEGMDLSGAIHVSISSHLTTLKHSNGVSREQAEVALASFGPAGLTYVLGQIGHPSAKENLQRREELNRIEDIDERLRELDKLSNSDQTSLEMIHLTGYLMQLGIEGKEAMPLIKKHLQPTVAYTGTTIPIEEFSVSQFVHYGTWARVYARVGDGNEILDVLREVTEKAKSVNISSWDQEGCVADLEALISEIEAGNVEAISVPIRGNSRW